MKREELLKLINLALDIQERGEGVDGFPCVSVDLSNYGTNITIRIRDEGFSSGAPADGIYDFNFNELVSRRMYNACESHLRELRERVRGFREEGGDSDD